MRQQTPHLLKADNSTNTLRAAQQRAACFYPLSKSLTYPQRLSILIRMTKPSGPGKSKRFVMGRLLAKFRMAAKQLAGPKRKRRSAPKPKTARRRRPQPKRRPRRQLRPKR